MFLLEESKRFYRPSTYFTYGPQYSLPKLPNMMAYILKESSRQNSNTYIVPLHPAILQGGTWISHISMLNILFLLHFLPISSIRKTTLVANINKHLTYKKPLFFATRSIFVESLHLLHKYLLSKSYAEDRRELLWKPF